MNLSKVAATLLGAIAAFLVSLPPDAHRAAGVAIWFLVLDTASGVVAARIRGPITSCDFRLGIKEKLSCYGVIIGFALGLAVISHAPLWYSCAWWGVCGAEAFSVMENLRVMLRKGGSPMRPLSRFLDVAASFIERVTGVAQEDAPQEGGAVQENTNGDKAK